LPGHPSFNPSSFFFYSRNFLPPVPNIPGFLSGRPDGCFLTLALPLAVPSQGNMAPFFFFGNFCRLHLCDFSGFFGSAILFLCRRLSKCDAAHGICLLGGPPFPAFVIVLFADSCSSPFPDSRLAVSNFKSRFEYKLRLFSSLLALEFYSFRGSCDSTKMPL